ncbi:DEAD/DEAH box helicase [Maritimibacter sp. 55A14]|uniref:DEAD/DEAH box helicase n=1 Tax=Maritimibacter sp. 55A14 TaxID=2174844 RepID=UPI000D607869|nr:DEAD/DEAH box helicase [Maritimibacter sp. 55A14]PWE33346.1 DEAD/DEAH box helicase [Maritimibacter sp. 55A14]
MSQFEALGLSPRLLKSLASLGYEVPTPIQAQAIPLILRGRDLMGLAQTGTGKTAAFGLPLIHHLMAEHARPDARSCRSLILAPTRELANQIADNLRGFTRGTPLTVTVVVGGASLNVQTRNLQRGTDILVATPGRLLDLIERRAVTLAAARFLVLDEADQMLDMGFIHALRRIAPLLAKPRQTLLFSATMPKQMAELSAAYLHDPERVQVSPPGKAADKITQEVHFVTQAGKTALLKELLAKHPNSLSLVFARTKHGAERLMKSLVAEGFRAASIHGNKSQGQRDRALKGFREGQIRILVATDVAARGIDIPDVRQVYNYDLPEVAENYVHRIGRTARAGKDGTAIAFCTPGDIGLLRAVEKIMGIKVAVASGEVPPESAAAPKARSAGRGNHGGGNTAAKPRRQRSRARRGPSRKAA